jgi:hypothetical protein
MGALGVVMHHQPIRRAGILVLFDLARERNRPSFDTLSYFTPPVGATLISYILYVCEIALFIVVITPWHVVRNQSWIKDLLLAIERTDSRWHGL